MRSARRPSLDNSHTTAQKQATNGELGEMRMTQTCERPKTLELYNFRVVEWSK